MNYSNVIDEGIYSLQLLQKKGDLYVIYKTL